MVWNHPGAQHPVTTLRIIEPTKKQIIMKKQKLNSAKEFKVFMRDKTRDQITMINELELGPVYPLIEVSNKHVMYYDLNEQKMKEIFPPFEISFRNLKQENS